MKDKRNIEKSMDRKLSVVISLLLKIANEGKAMTMREQINELATFGLKSAEIAEIVGKKIGYVSKELSTLKKSK